MANMGNIRGSAGEGTGWKVTLTATMTAPADTNISITIMQENVGENTFREDAEMLRSKIKTTYKQLMQKS